MLSTASGLPVSTPHTHTPLDVGYGELSWCTFKLYCPDSDWVYPHVSGLLRTDSISRVQFVVHSRALHRIAMALVYWVQHTRRCVRMAWTRCMPHGNCKVFLAGGHGGRWRVYADAPTHMFYLTHETRLKTLLVLNTGVCRQTMKRMWTDSTLALSSFH